MTNPPRGERAKTINNNPRLPNLITDHNQEQCSRFVGGLARESGALGFGVQVPGCAGCERRRVEFGSPSPCVEHSPEGVRHVPVVFEDANVDVLRSLFGEAR